MKVAAKIKSKVKNIQPGRIFNYSDLGVTRNEYGAAAKALSRLVNTKAVKRFSTGIFYRPKKTVFGELSPSENELIKPYLFRGRKRIAYVTGAALFNRLSLTTQVPKNIDIASRAQKPVSKISTYIIALNFSITIDRLFLFLTSSARQLSGSSESVAQQRLNVSIS